MTTLGQPFKAQVLEKLLRLLSDNDVNRLGEFLSLDYQLLDASAILLEPSSKSSIMVGKEDDGSAVFLTE